MRLEAQASVRSVRCTGFSLHSLVRCTGFSLTFRRQGDHDAAGRRTKLSFKSANRTGYLNLDTSQTYSYDSNKHRLTQIQRESSGSEKGQYFYDDSDGRLTKVAYGNGARAEYGYDASGALPQRDNPCDAACAPKWRGL